MILDVDNNKESIGAQNVTTIIDTLQDGFLHIGSDRYILGPLK